MRNNLLKYKKNGLVFVFINNKKYKSPYNMKIIQIIIMLLFIIPASANNPQNVTKNIENAVRNGQSKELANYFYENIQLTIDKNNNIYSKKQAEKVLESFFSNHRPVKFSVSNEKIKGNSVVVIGILETPTHNYRVFYRLRKYNGKLLISSINFELL